MLETNNLAVELHGRQHGSYCSYELKPAFSFNGLSADNSDNCGDTL